MILLCKRSSNIFNCWQWPSADLIIPFCKALFHWVAWFMSIFGTHRHTDNSPIMYKIYVDAFAGDMDDEFQGRRSVWAHRSNRSALRHAGEPQLGHAISTDPQRPQVWLQARLRRGTHCHTAQRREEDRNSAHCTQTMQGARRCTEVSRLHRISG